MASLINLPRQALGGLRHRLQQLPWLGTPRNGSPPEHALASPAPNDWRLADCERVEAYRRAIERHVRPGLVVADLGTGTGLRAFLAAQRQPRKLYAVEDSRNLDTARWVARRHGLSHIHFVRSPPHRFHPQEPLDVLLHDHMGEALFDTGLIAVLLEARQRLLRSGGRILPNRFEVFIEPVQLREEARLPFIWSQQLPSVDYRCLHALRHEMSPAYFTRLIRPYDVHHLLCDPEPAFAFDLETLQASHLPHRLHTSRPVVHPGRLDGFCLFYRAWFDAELSFGTLPPGRALHAPAVLLRVDSREYARFQSIHLELELPELAELASWRWRFE